jgi:alkyl hydroperoxide reductase subunit AhpF
MKRVKLHSKLRKSKKPKSRNNRRRRTYRRQYNGGAPAGTAAAILAETTAIDAAFNAAVGGANLTREEVKQALVVHKASVPALSSEAKRHMVALMNSLNQYSPDTVITPALLAASRAHAKATKDSAVAADVASRSGPQQRVLDGRINHNGNPKVNPASPKRPPSP